MFGIHTRPQSQVHKCSHWLPCLCPVLTAHTDPNGLSPRQIKSDSDDDDLPNVTLDSVNETGSTALSIARAVQEWVSWSVCLGNVDPLYWLFLLCWPQHVLKKKKKKNQCISVLNYVLPGRCFGGSVTICILCTAVCCLFTWEFLVLEKVNLS